MRFLSKEEFEKELKTVGLTPTDERTNLGRVWITGKGEKVMLPETNHKIPDSILEVALKQAEKKIRR
ncbi:MAG: hypothetical protein F4239_05480 [Gammaproteobacteria bacterium]|nr:hypothetical protein [Gammaproteobacteria bacterium]